MTRSKRKRSARGSALRKPRRIIDLTDKVLVVRENRSPTGQRLANSYMMTATPELIEPVKVWTWEELKADGPSWEPPAYRCEGVTAKGERCSRVVFGAHCCHWHESQEETDSELEGFVDVLADILISGEE